MITFILDKDNCPFHHTVSSLKSNATAPLCSYGEKSRFKSPYCRTSLVRCLIKHPLNNIAVTIDLWLQIRKRLSYLCMLKTDRQYSRAIEYVMWWNKSLMHSSCVRNCTNVIIKIEETAESWLFIKQLRIAFDGI